MMGGLFLERKDFEKEAFERRDLEKIPIFGEKCLEVLIDGKRLCVVQIHSAERSGEAHHYFYSLSLRAGFRLDQDMFELLLKGYILTQSFDQILRLNFTIHLNEELFRIVGTRDQDSLLLKVFRGNSLEQSISFPFEKEMESLLSAIPLASHSFETLSLKWPGLQMREVKKDEATFNSFQLDHPDIKGVIHANFRD